VSEQTAACFQWQGQDVLLNCRLQPKASKDEFSQVVGDQIKIRITAPPVDGKANKHLIKFLAKQFNVTQDSVCIVSGENSRQKRIKILGPQRLPEALLLQPPVHTNLHTDSAKT